MIVRKRIFDEELFCKVASVIQKKAEYEMKKVAFGGPLLPLAGSAVGGALSLGGAAIGTGIGMTSSAIGGSVPVVTEATGSLSSDIVRSLMQDNEMLERLKRKIYMKQLLAKDVEDTIRRDFNVDVNDLFKQIREKEKALKDGKE